MKIDSKKINNEVNFCQKPTRFLNLTPFTAGLIIAILFITAIYGVITYDPLPPGPVENRPKGEDLRCQRAIIERIQSGESYYSAAEIELRKRGYPLRSVFNWRLPGLAWLLGHLPSLFWGQALGVILAIMTFLIWLRILDSLFSFSHVLVGSLLILAPPIYGILPGIFLAHEFWAGTCIALSLGACARGWRSVSITSGLMALFIRELTLPFIMVMLILSYIERRRSEAVVWLMGVVVFAGALLIHWSIVTDLIKEGDRALEGGWIAFGGWRFVLSTAQMHPYLFLGPPWITAIVLPLVLLGLAGWRDKFWLRVTLTVHVYVISFLIVGKPFNRYWGFMYTNILLLGFLNVSQSLRDLWRSVRRISVI
jgi:hypothetical protein